MGYTNYYYQERDFTDKEWGDVIRESAYVQELGFDVNFHRDRNTGTQELGEVNIITLDGECETLVLRKYRRTEKSYEDENLSFDFCKTRMCKYDIAVKHLLRHCHSLLGNDFTYSSD
tara:strand:- start:3290 stop:3640 length:351 start_codon:yes stop_codon:yes gene_type:complete